MMRTTVLAVLALTLTLGLTGCGRRSHADVQRDVTAAAEELAEVLASNATDAQKLSKVEPISERLKALADEAKELGNPPKTAAKQVSRFRQRDLDAANKILAVAKK